MDVDLERPRGQVDLGRLGGDELGAEPGGLVPEALHEVWAEDAVREAWVVLDVRRQHQLTTWLVARARRLAFDDQRVEVGPRGVDRGGQPGRAGADDDDLASVGSVRQENRP